MVSTAWHSAPTAAWYARCCSTICVIAQRATATGISTSTGAKSPVTFQSAAMSSPKAPYPRSDTTSSKLMPMELRRSSASRLLVSQSTPPSSPWFVTAWTTAATAKGPITPGNDPDPGMPTCPPVAMKARPAR